MTRAVPLILAVALFMEQMDSTVIATALPAIADDIGSDPIALKLALTAYMVALAVFIPVSGWMADRFGPRRIFRLAIAVFVGGSLACAAADSLGWFVGARFLQGVGGAMMTPVGRLLLVRSTRREDLVQAMAWITVPALIGPIAGPPVGGFLTTFFSWHWIFLINLPIGIAGIWLAGHFLPDLSAETPGPIDRIGFVLVAVAASGLVFGLSVISLPALPLWAGIAAIVAGTTALASYFVHARMTPRPLLDPALFRHRSFAAAVAGGSLFRIGIGAVPFLMPLMLQLMFGYSPFESGMITFIGAAGALSMKFVAKPLLRAVGFRRVLVFGVLSSSVLVAVLGLFTAATPVALILAALYFGGLTRSVVFTSINALAFAETDDREAAQATAITSAMQQVSLAMGVAAAGSLLELHDLWTGDGLSPGAFAFAFTGVGAVSALAALAFARLSPGTGASMSGHVLRQREDSSN